MKEQVLKVIRDRIAELLVKNKWPLLDVTSGAYTEEIETRRARGPRPARRELRHPHRAPRQLRRSPSTSRTRANLKRLYTDAAYLRTVGGVGDYQQLRRRQGDDRRRRGHGQGRRRRRAAARPAAARRRGPRRRLRAGADARARQPRRRDARPGRARRRVPAAAAPSVPPGRFCGACGAELVPKAAGPGSGLLRGVRRAARPGRALLRAVRSVAGGRVPGFAPELACQRVGRSAILFSPFPRKAGGVVEFLRQGRTPRPPRFLGKSPVRGTERQDRPLITLGTTVWRLPPGGRQAVRVSLSSLIPFQEKVYVSFDSDRDRRGGSVRSGLRSAANRPGRSTRSRFRSVTRASSTGRPSSGSPGPRRACSCPPVTPCSATTAPGPAAALLRQAGRVLGRHRRGTAAEHHHASVVGVRLRRVRHPHPDRASPSPGATDDQIISSAEFGYCTHTLTGTVDIKIGFYDDLGGNCANGIPVKGKPYNLTLPAAGDPVRERDGLLRLRLRGRLPPAGLERRRPADLLDHDHRLPEQRRLLHAVGRRRREHSHETSSRGPSRATTLRYRPRRIRARSSRAIRTSAGRAQARTTSRPVDAVFGRCGTGHDVFDGWWLNIDGSSTAGTPGSCAGPPISTGCYWFGGWPGNPLGSFWMVMDSTGSCSGCANRPTTYCTAGTTQLGLPGPDLRRRHLERHGPVGLLREGGERRRRPGRSLRLRDQRPEGRRGDPVGRHLELPVHRAAPGVHAPAGRRRLQRFLRRHLLDGPERPFATNPNHNPGAGAQIDGQYLIRDPGGPSPGTALSNALTFTVCP